MSIDLSKINYGIIVDAGEPGVVVSKVNYGIITAEHEGQGISITKVNFCVIVGPEPEPRRRQMACVP